ncbi:MAG: HDOD domain-containing protein [Candidatus Latescibacteria bacterium]|nr:HDOD domain-containing protein [Candidatus Latescibacterota bacterium]
MPDNKRVLFVDDEPRILDGLRRMLRPMRHQWDMAFAGSGPDALDLLAREPFDAIVTDMRMPGMDGAQLLKEVIKRYPRMIRIALSGQTSSETMFQVSGMIHQYLSKPCDAKILKSALVNAWTVRDHLETVELRELISQIETLPSLPSLYHEIVESVQSNKSSSKEVGRIVSKDIGMTAKILKLVNSAFFGFPRHIANPVQAVVLLGLETIKNLILSIHIFSQFDQAELETLSLDALWSHSMAVGAFAKRIAKTESADQKSSDEAFIAGMLHDVGKLVLAANLPQKYGAMLALAAEEGIEQSEAEYRIFGASHGDVGAFLLEFWGLPDPLFVAAAFHHTPGKHSDKDFNTLTAVHVANVLEHEADPAKAVAAAMDRSYLSGLGLTERIPVWRESCLKPIQEGTPG